MLFNSWEFILLFLITAVLYFKLSYKYGVILLLISSYVFYIYWRWDFALVMLGVTLINFYTSIQIDRSQNKNVKKVWLYTSIALSLLPLFYFKYANFFIDNANSVLTFIDSDTKFSTLNLLLPVGISFFTFQAMSYSLDIYFNKTKIENNIVNFTVFVAFFPQLVAGPIERSSQLLSQFKVKHHFNKEYFLQGSKLFIWGLFKKVVIADRLALYVDKVYETPEAYSGLTLSVATLFFAVQIYCDFSGYSDMAIGTARALGFKLMQNFNLPYFASSIADFWRRWHISLSSWFGDYVYKPLGGSRVIYWKWLRNILIVFIVSGFWHGANWTFIIWGTLHAFYYFIESWGDTFLKKIHFEYIKNTRGYKFFKVGVVFLATCYAWVYFRSNSVTDAFIITKRIFNNWGEHYYFGASTVTFTLSCILIVFIFAFQLLQYNGIASLYFSKSRVHPILETGWYLLLLLGISLLGLSSNSFIYFQF